MTNADRLRQAAHQLDKWASGRDAWTDNTSMAAQDSATAALLRAVALMQEEYLDNTGNPRIFKALPIYNTAHALADEILGDTND